MKVVQEYRKSSKNHNLVTFYKVQTYNQISMCWQSIKGSYDSIDSAMASYPKNKTCRLVMVDKDAWRVLG